MKGFSKGFIFFIGWVLSPFTWWNDAFVNIPLSYLAANILFYTVHLNFKWLVVGTYWFTNILGLFFMYLSGKSIFAASKDKARTFFMTAGFFIIYSAIMFYLGRHGKLLPLGSFF